MYDAISPHVRIKLHGYAHTVALIIYIFNGMEG
jgi:hypothetical protein